MKKTKIEWCDATWNPVTGCLHGCDYCYARTIARRFSEKIYESAPLHYLEEPIKRGEIIKPSGKIIADRAPYPYGFEPTFHRYRLNEPKRWTRPRAIFVCSMADLFGDWVPTEWIMDVFRASLQAPQHRYLFLTKNPARYLELSNQWKLPIQSNIFYGASATNRNQFAKAQEVFTSIYPKVRSFLSIEPMLEDITDEMRAVEHEDLPEWIIMGAETGNRKNKIIPPKDWVHFTSKIAHEWERKVFMKDSLIPIIGEENMRRELPWQST